MDRESVLARLLGGDTYASRSVDGIKRAASALADFLTRGANAGIADMDAALSGYRVPQGAVLTDAGYVMPENIARGNYDRADVREPDVMRALTLMGGAMTPARGVGIAAKAGAEGKAAVAAANVARQNEGMGTIYRDIMGIHQPNVTLTYTSPMGSYGGYWHAASPADNWPFAGRKWTSEVDALNDLAADGWVESGRRDMGMLGRHINLQHPETQKAAMSAAQAFDEKWKDAVPVYVRYGDIPKSGRSWDHAGNRSEAGVSVFRGRMLPTGEAMAVPSGNQEFASMLSIKDRPLYIVDGKEIGIGADGEPVLDGARIIRKALTR